MASSRRATDAFVESAAFYGSMAVGAAICATLIAIWLLWNAPRLLLKVSVLSASLFSRHFRRALRWGVTALASGGFLWILLSGVPLLATYQQLRSGRISFADLPFNDVTKVALEMKLDQGKSQFAYSIVLFGVLWGFVAVSKDRPRLSAADIPELIILTMATLVLVANGASFVYYMNTLSRLTATAGRQGGSSMPDSLDSRVEGFARFQRNSLFVAALMVALLVISMHRLREEDHAAQSAR